MSEITARQAEVLCCIGRGFSIEETARRLGISYHTVKNQLGQTHYSLDVSTRVEAVLRAITRGILTLGADGTIEVSEKMRDEAAPDVTRSCPTCREPFTCKRGALRRYCSAACYRARPRITPAKKAASGAEHPWRRADRLRAARNHPEQSERTA